MLSSGDNPKLFEIGHPIVLPNIRNCCLSRLGPFLTTCLYRGGHYLHSTSLDFNPLSRDISALVDWVPSWLPASVEVDITSVVQVWTSTNMQRTDPHWQHYWHCLHHTKEHNRSNMEIRIMDQDQIPIYDFIKGYPLRSYRFPMFWVIQPFK